MSPEERSRQVLDKWRGEFVRASLASKMNELKHDIAAAIREAVEAERERLAKSSFNFGRPLTDEESQIVAACKIMHERTEAEMKRRVEAERDRALEVLGELISDKLGPADPVNAALSAAMFNIAHPDAPTRGRDDRPIDQSPASR